MVFKRAFDIVVSGGLLLLLLPLFLLIFILVRYKLGSPVFFRQARPGREGRLFELIKFRTMLDGYDSMGNELADEHRLTDFGRFLRATSLDELPELWNVFKGEMSLVGPRPLLMEYLPLYSDDQRRRHEVRPGITGWAQVNGRNNLSWEDRFKMDVWYVDNQSFWLDLKILLMTVKKVFLREDINQDGHATAEKFKGNN
jgi:lipopolysaccharide/colanic/teichoic acid biosynthesis glycosyltransferase